MLDNGCMYVFVYRGHFLTDIDFLKKCLVGSGYLLISIHTAAISAMISQNMSIPFKKIFSFKNSL